ncbi:MAG TPA: hypothetical protein PK812_04525 [Beijerinckiaceae bacterium]|nr:hypothetical protein [Beijerinckiaceae bacterium]
MIRLASIKPGVSHKSGRRYFRGRLADGSTVWLIEDHDSPGWTLKLDPHEERPVTIDAKVSSVAKLLPSRTGDDDRS